MLKYSKEKFFDIFIYMVTFLILIYAITIRIENISQKIEFFGPDDFKYSEKSLQISKYVKESFNKSIPKPISLINSLSYYNQIYYEAKPAFMMQLAIWNLFLNPSLNNLNFYPVSYNIFLFALSLFLLLFLGMLFNKPFFSLFSIAFWGFSSTTYLHTFWGLEKMTAAFWLLLALFLWVLSLLKIKNHPVLNTLIQILCGLSLFISLFSSYSVIPFVLISLLIFSAPETLTRISFFLLSDTSFEFKPLKINYKIFAGFFTGMIFHLFFSLWTKFFMKKEIVIGYINSLLGILKLNSGYAGKLPIYPLFYFDYIRASNGRIFIILTMIGFICFSIFLYKQTKNRENIKELTLVLTLFIEFILGFICFTFSGTAQVARTYFSVFLFNVLFISFVLSQTLQRLNKMVSIFIICPLLLFFYFDNTNGIIMVNNYSLRSHQINKTMREKNIDRFAVCFKDAPLPYTLINYSVNIGSLEDLQKINKDISYLLVASAFFPGRKTFQFNPIMQSLILLKSNGKISEDFSFVFSPFAPYGCFESELCYHLERSINIKKPSPSLNPGVIFTDVFVPNRVYVFKISNIFKALDNKE